MTLESVIQNARRESAVRSDGDLPLHLRLDIWNAMDLRFQDGKRRRAMISYLVAQTAVASLETMPLAGEDRRDIEEILSATRLVILNGTSEAEKALLKRSWTTICNIQSKYDESFVNPLAAAWAAYAALQCSIEDEDRYSEHPQRRTLTESDVEPQNGDAHFFGSVVAADGAAWEPTSSVNRRRSYWNQWLDEFLPLVAQPSVDEALRIISG
jgi:hypothetical protein